MANSISSTSSHKVDMSEAAIAAYQRRLAAGDRGNLPSHPSVGIAKKHAHSSAVLATTSDLGPKLWKPEESKEALRASTLANTSDVGPKLWKPTKSSEAASAALKSKDSVRKVPAPSVDLSKSASKAALSAAGTSGEEYGAKYLKDGYEWTARTAGKNAIGEWAHLAATRSATMTAAEEKLAAEGSAAALKRGPTNDTLESLDISRIESKARENARKTLSNVYVDVSRNKLQFKGADGKLHDDPAMNDYIGEQQYFQRQDVLSLVSIADRNVKAQLAQVNKDVADRSLFGNDAYQKTALALATEKYKKRTANIGKVDVGGGLYMTQEEINDIARRSVQPTLDEVSDVAKQKRQADKEQAEKEAAERKAREEAKAKERKEKEEQAKADRERKEKEKKKRDEEKAEERKRKAEEKQKRDEQRAKEKKIADEKKAEERKIAEAKKAEERKANEERKAAERKANEERKAAEAKKAEERKALEAKKAEEKKAAEAAAPAAANKSVSGASVGAVGVAGASGASAAGAGESEEGGLLGRIKSVFRSGEESVEHEEKLSEEELAKLSPLERAKHEAKSAKRTRLRLEDEAKRLKAEAAAAEEAVAQSISRHRLAKKHFFSEKEAAEKQAEREAEEKAAREEKEKAEKEAAAKKEAALQADAAVSAAKDSEQKANKTADDADAASIKPDEQLETIHEHSEAASPAVGTPFPNKEPVASNKSVKSTQSVAGELPAASVKDADKPDAGVSASAAAAGAGAAGAAGLAGSAKPSAPVSDDIPLGSSKEVAPSTTGKPPVDVKTDKKIIGDKLDLKAPSSASAPKEESEALIVAPSEALITEDEAKAITEPTAVTGEAQGASAKEASTKGADSEALITEDEAKAITEPAPVVTETKGPDGPGADSEALIVAPSEALITEDEAKAITEPTPVEVPASDAKVTQPKGDVVVPSASSSETAKGVKLKEEPRGVTLKGDDKFAGFDSSNVTTPVHEAQEGLFKEDI